MVAEFINEECNEKKLKISLNKVKFKSLQWVDQNSRCYEINVGTWYAIELNDFWIIFVANMQHCYIHSIKQLGKLFTLQNGLYQI